MNSHIHLLEALAEFYRVEKTPVVKQRLEETPGDRPRPDRRRARGANLYLTRDWQAAPAHDSFGHDVETAYLLVEAAEALGMPDDPKTWQVARSLVDHALDWGWDDEHGGFYDKGDVFAGQAYDTTKVWWTQAEGLNALLLMHRKYGDETDRYWQGLPQAVGLHRGPPDRPRPRRLVHARRPARARSIGDGRKATQWKANYHTGRALMNVATMLGEIEPRRPAKERIARPLRGRGLARRAVERNAVRPRRVGSLVVLEDVQAEPVELLLGHLERRRRGATRSPRPPRPGRLGLLPGHLELAAVADPDVGAEVFEVVLDRRARAGSTVKVQRIRSGGASWASRLIGPPWSVRRVAGRGRHRLTVIIGWSGGRAEPKSATPRRSPAPCPDPRPTSPGRPARPAAGPSPGGRNGRRDWDEVRYCSDACRKAASKSEGPPRLNHEPRLNPCPWRSRRPWPRRPGCSRRGRSGSAGPAGRRRPRSTSKSRAVSSR